MIIAEKYKYTAAGLDFVFDWSQWLIPGDQIVSSAWVTLPASTEGDGALFTSNLAFTATTTTVWLWGGKLGNVRAFVVRNNIVTASGKKDQREFVINILD